MEPAETECVLAEGVDW